MKIDFDPEVDAAYLQLDDAKIVGSEEVLPGVVFKLLLVTRNLTSAWIMRSLVLSVIAVLVGYSNEV